MRPLSAPVKDPFSYPNNSASKSSAGIAAELTATNLPVLPDNLCIPLAINSLPDPVGPTAKTFTGYGAASSICRRTSFIFSEEPAIKLSRNFDPAIERPYF